MLKVLYVLNHAGKAGTERYVESLASGLDNKKTKVYFAYNEDGLLVEKLKGLGIETFHVNMRNRFDVKAAREISILCRKLSIDLIHTQFLRENYIALLSRFFNPKVRVVYTNHMILENDFFTRLSNKALSVFQAQIIAVCNKGKDMLVRNGFNERKIQVLFNAVNPDYWKQPLISTIRDEYDIKPEAFVLLSAARFVPGKGHVYLVEALSELMRTGKRHIKCILAGDGSLMEEIKAQVYSLGLEDVVIFCGFRSDIKNMCYGSNAFISHSDSEALSFAIIEALASGLPVIATDVGGNRDILNPETDCGILVEYENKPQLVSAVNELMSSSELRERYRMNALKTVHDRFNLDKMLEKTYNLYESVCKRI